MASKIDIQKVDALPVTLTANTIYFIKHATGSLMDIKMTNAAGTVVFSGIGESEVLDVVNSRIGVSGGAAAFNHTHSYTTSDIAEGTNLYWTSSRSSTYGIRVTNQASSAYATLNDLIADSTPDTIFVDSAGIVYRWNAGNEVQLNALPQTNDTTTSATVYPLFVTSAVASSATAVKVSSSKLYFNPSTGVLSATNFNTLSDIRLKTDLVKITDGLDFVRAIDAYEYTMIDSSTKSAGVIANSIYKVKPYLVDINRDTTIMSVNWQGINAFSLAAVKQLDQIVTEQDITISELQQQLLDIQNELKVMKEVINGLSK